MASMEEHAQKLEFRAVLVSLIISSFAFVAALFWRDAIKALIDELVPEGQGIIYSLGVALIATVIAVIAIFIISKILLKEEGEKKQ